MKAGWSSWWLKFASRTRIRGMTTVLREVSLFIRSTSTRILILFLNSILVAIRFEVLLLFRSKILIVMSVSVSIIGNWYLVTCILMIILWWSISRALFIPYLWDGNFKNAFALWVLTWIFNVLLARIGTLSKDKWWILVISVMINIVIHIVADIQQYVRTKILYE